MRYIVVLFLLICELFAAGIEAPIVKLQEDRAVISIDKIDVGMSGYVIHKFSQEHQTIVKKAVVESFDPQKKEATVVMQEFVQLANNALPKGEWKVKEGDFVVLPYMYNRGIVIAPSEDVYYTIVGSVDSIEWIHADFFATYLSDEGHPTPLESDFSAFSKKLSVGLVFLYLDELLYTIDAQTMKILNISDAPLQNLAKEKKLPFYSRLEEIDAAWWGEGSDELKSYEPYYYELLVEYNKENKTLYEKIGTLDKSMHHLLDEFEIKG